MTHKELLESVARKAKISVEESEELLAVSVNEISKLLSDGKSIGVQSFGTLEVKKKEERLSVHPATGVRTMVPPKLVVNFKQSPQFKSKLKES